jgi:hypothetical protein
VLDAVYASTQAGNYIEGPKRLKEWLEGPEAQLVPDTDAIIQQVQAWQKDRAVAETLRTVVSHGIGVRQPVVALTAAEAALRRLPAFSAASEADAVAMAQYASQTGRRALARRLLENYAAAHPDSPLSPSATALRASLDG